jgi:HK97 family phage prohead protease
MRAHLSQVNLRAAEDSSGGVRFDGHASVTETAYEMWDWYGPYSEVVSASAFDASLSRADLDVPFVIGHDQLRRIARTTTGTLQLAMDEIGLHVRADLDMADADVAYIVPKLRAGLIDEMSFAFRITRGIWSPDYTEYRIEELDIHRGDVAIVGWGANPSTDGGVREDVAPNENSRAQALLALALAVSK